MPDVAFCLVRRHCSALLRCPLLLAILPVGCYWGTEKYIVKDFQKKFPGSIKSAKVGFMATDPNNPLTQPDYRQVCSGTTGYVEVLYVELNEPVADYYEPLIRFFFQFHDPTTKNRQGNDAGPQYASVIFFNGPEQEQVALKVKSELQQLLDQSQIRQFANDAVATEILPATPFIEAHEEHQEYLAKNPNGYCNHAIRFSEWPALN
jgi:peptide-methionine (S)-S-oxide reductase